MRRRCSATGPRGADAAAMPVKSFVKHFRSEFQHHIDHKRCLVGPYL